MVTNHRFVNMVAEGSYWRPSRRTLRGPSYEVSVWSIAPAKRCLVTLLVAPEQTAWELLQSVPDVESVVHAWIPQKFQSERTVGWVFIFTVLIRLEKRTGFVSWPESRVWTLPRHTNWPCIVRCHDTTLHAILGQGPLSFGWLYSLMLRKTSFVLYKT